MVLEDARDKRTRRQIVEDWPPAGVPLSACPWQCAQTISSRSAAAETNQRSHFLAGRLMTPCRGGRASASQCGGTLRHERWLVPSDGIAEIVGKPGASSARTLPTLGSSRESRHYPTPRAAHYVHPCSS